MTAFGGHRYVVGTVDLARSQVRLACACGISAEAKSVDAAASVLKQKQCSAQPLVSPSYQAQTSGAGEDISDFDDLHDVLAGGGSGGRRGLPIETHERGTEAEMLKAKANRARGRGNR